MATTASNDIVTTIGIDLCKNDPGTPNIFLRHAAIRNNCLKPDAIRAGDIKRQFLLS
jgi:hypothetical protein